MKRTFGFTLVELITTLSVLGILVAVAAPSLANLLANNRMATATNSIIAGLQTARSEAITREVPMVFCARNLSGTDCSGTLSNLAQGWLVGTDPNGNGSVADDGEVIRLSEPGGGNLSYSIGTVVDRNEIRYRPTGLVANGVLDPADPAVVLLDLCDNDRTGEEGRRLNISKTGAVSLNPSNPTCP
jgi:type IV fimbrial biogenesis protein FimT